VDTLGNVVQPAVPTAETKLDPKNLKIESINFQKPLTDCGTGSSKISENYWTYLLLGFIGGLIALLTPCVFPMIPLTVSFFTKGNKIKQKEKEMLYLRIFHSFNLCFTECSFPFIDGIAGNIFNKFQPMYG
jgi:thiol:disulfide interchange protein DsbD